MKITNTLSGRKETFKPLNDKKIKIYVCGITPYDLSHIGHARTYVAFDVIRKYLEYKGYKVHYTVNVTDVDDKIIKRANETNKDPIRLAKEITDLFIEDMHALNVRDPDFMPKVSETIPEIVEFIGGLIKKGYAYVLDGDVYFDVSKFKDYGKLSGNKSSAMKEGARIEPDPRKNNPADFALWKAAKPGEPFWPSPWSRGRPGWHIECSAMNKKIFGSQIDIHGGGMDLKFPHHENEIAQTESLTGKKFAKYWMHTGFLTVDGEKMSKSLGNFTTIRDMLREVDPLSLRFFFLRTHYKNPIDFSQKAIAEANESREKINKTYNDILMLIETAPKVPNNKEAKHIVDDAYRRFNAAMDDDFSTPEALGAAFVLTREANRIISASALNRNDLSRIKGFYDDINSVFSILEDKTDDRIPNEVVELFNMRQELRASGKFKEADAARDKIKALGYLLEDSPSGTKIRKI